MFHGMSRVMSMRAMRALRCCAAFAAVAFLCGTTHAQTFGDFDGDGAIGPCDTREFVRCFSGAGTPVESGCAGARFDSDSDSDLRDFRAFMSAFNPRIIREDACEDAIPVFCEGTFGFDNSNATLDGPAHAACANAGADQIDRDVWTCWTSPCTSLILVETCDQTELDTRIAVYEGCECPVSDAQLLTCNDDSCNVQSSVTFEAAAGQSYLIRTGSFPGLSGDAGALTISCGFPTCPGEGSCFSAHIGQGCVNPTCCNRVCTFDPLCCENRWDSTCAREGQGLCNGSFDTCGAGRGACGEANLSPGCDDVECCNTVCQVDPACCISSWDERCATLEAELCFGSCTASSGDCFTGRTTPGCESEACCSEVCPRDPFCCREAWDGRCAEEAEQFCR